MSPNKPDLLIVGGTGKIGSELSSLLIRAGIKFRLLLRPGSTAELPGTDMVEIAYGDLADPDSIKTALRDIKRVFLLTRDQPEQGQLEQSLIELSMQNGVEKIVKSSAYAAGLTPPVGYGITHAVSEHKLVSSGLNWVILRPYMFMQNFIELCDLISTRNIIPLPLKNALVGLIDARDVALTAKTVLTSTGFDNKIYELSGPEALSMSDCAEIFSKILNRPIQYRSPPFLLAGFMMRMQGDSAWDIKMRKQLFRMIADGGEEKLTNNLEKITGQKPGTMEMFVRENQHVFE